MRLAAWGIQAELVTDRRVTIYKSLSTDGRKQQTVVTLVASFKTLTGEVASLKVLKASLQASVLFANPCSVVLLFSKK